jgi:hypothetical protein
LGVAIARSPFPEQEFDAPSLASLFGSLEKF